MTSRERRVTRLQLLMEQRRLTREETLAALRSRAASIPGVDFTLSLRQLDRWLAGELDGLPRPSTCRVVEAEFGHSIEELLASVAESPGSERYEPQSVQLVEVRGLVSEAAIGSARFSVWAESGSISNLAVDLLRAQVVHLADEYVHAPLVPIFGELVILRDQLFRALRDKRDSQHLRELYFLAGAVCAMLAYASGDLGFPRPAMMQSQTAMVCAGKAASSALTAWILGNRGMTSDWFGNSRDGVRFAQQAHGHARHARVQGTLQARLASLEARAQGRLGRPDDARMALERAEDARAKVAHGVDGGVDDLDEIGGILTFTLAKQHFYEGSTYLRMGEAEAAQRSALAAIEAYRNGPESERSYGDEALAWIDVAAARTCRPVADLDGVLEALGPVLRLPSELRLAALAGPLTELHAKLHAPMYERAPLAREISDSISHFVVTCSTNTNVRIDA